MSISTASGIGTITAKDQTTITWNWAGNNGKCKVQFCLDDLSKSIVEVKNQNWKKEDSPNLKYIKASLDLSKMSCLGRIKLPRLLKGSAPLSLNVSIKLKNESYRVKPYLILNPDPIFHDAKGLAEVIKS